MTDVSAHYFQPSSGIPRAYPISDAEAMRVQKAIDELKSGLTQIIEESCGGRAKPLSFDIQGDPARGLTLGVTRLRLCNGKEVDLTAPRNPGSTMLSLLRNSTFYNFLADNGFLEVVSPTGQAYQVGQA